MSPVWTTESSRDSSTTHTRIGPILIAYADLIDGMGLVVISDERPAQLGGTLMSKGTYTANAHIARRIAERLAERLEPPVPVSKRYHGGNCVDFWVLIPGLDGCKAFERGTVIKVDADAGQLTIQPEGRETTVPAPDDEPFGLPRPAIWYPPVVVVGEGTNVPLSRVVVRY